MQYINDFSIKQVKPEHIAEHIKQFITNSEQERFIVVYLNNAGDILDTETLFIGGSDYSIVDNRIILRHALLKIASALIVAHNHPSNNLKPSAKDIETTDKLSKACDLLNIKLLDHIIVNSLDQFTSFKLLNLL